MHLAGVHNQLKTTFSWLKDVQNFGCWYV